MSNVYDFDNEPEDWRDQIERELNREDLNSDMDRPRGIQTKRFVIKPWEYEN